MIEWSDLFELGVFSLVFIMFAVVIFGFFWTILLYISIEFLGYNLYTLGYD